MDRRAYPSDLSDAEWKLMAPHIPEAEAGGRPRARGQLTELRAADLRFTADEAAAFLNQTMDLALSSEAVEALEQRTEGWIVGLQLAALSM